ncbi:MAG TPA: lysylphosphatidylglycerol synthase transmembrane domain-containing protein [Ferruginibacter sp.]|nr:lysylphosphatidylglycerol synthase transmembrane domain-containing protein [Ferruginibacter sp.]
MRKRLLSIFNYVFFLGGGIFLVWWQLKSMTELEKKEFYAAFKHADYWVVIPIIIMSLLSHISRSMRWKLLMEPLGYKPSLKNVFSVTMVGYLANAAIPRLGEILKCTFLARYERLKVDKLVGTIIVERTFDFVCYLLFIALTVLIQIDVVGGYVKSKLESITSAPGFPLWGKLLIALGIVIILLMIVKWLFNRFPNNRVIFKINNFIKGIGEGFRSIRNLKHRKAFILHTIFIWSMYLLQIYLGFWAMDGTDHLGIKAAFSVLSLATLAMIATPGGIGSFPIFVGETLAIYGIISPVGTAFGWLMWGVATGIIIVAGLTALLLLPIINKHKNLHESSSIDT